jgi:hypothetical protein
LPFPQVVGAMPFPNQGIQVVHSSGCAPANAGL